MKTEKKYLCLDDNEWRLLIIGMNEWRNRLTEEGKDPSPINKVLLKLIDAPTKKIKVIREE